ncbi:MAG: 2-hydroxyacyl-CoA dehydratase [Clostridia bacterium]|nr:2-hydroxyacyl-CoA dehydratase [Clostridia bacterium]
MTNQYRIGLDIGSTTIKCVVLDEHDTILYSCYERHFSLITQKTREFLTRLDREFIHGEPVSITISGSAGMGLALGAGISFVQEVYATKVAADTLMPGTDCIIELGGEDAKILFLQGTLEVRMNGSCAGGTGAFIDQMATLLNTTPTDMNVAAGNAEKTYTIASRCGVFAKTDVQPLLNQGARHEDVSRSIFMAVVNQTIAGLAQGRPITGNVLYLGGPLTFLSELRACFDEALRLKGVCPENSLYFVAFGAAKQPGKAVRLADCIEAIDAFHSTESYNALPPLFESEDELAAFRARHAKSKVPVMDPAGYTGDVYLGIDSGSTTIKSVVISKDGQLLLTRYQSNDGDPVPHVLDFIRMLRTDYPGFTIRAAAVTGYGEDLIRNAFGVDFGLVETVAHFEAARAFLPDVDFIIDIGGQDIKCFKIHNGAIDNIFLNEACSSGCGSFLQTFAGALGYSIADFAQLGLAAKRPVDLGSRCTVFMNSSVKQAQKDGADITDISAGLSISVVKNALYKVIRCGRPEELGRKIVVQGGTFLNDAVLCAFEKELGVNVIRPDIAGLMGAYGAALYAKQQRALHPGESTVIDLASLDRFTHSVKEVRCGICENHCRLTVHDFGEKRKYISGNRCDRPVTGNRQGNELNLYAYKQEKISALRDSHPANARRGKIGIPLGLNLYELLPFWHTLFGELGFDVIVSPYSNRNLYIAGQATIPSDTVCFPAKLLHGHVQWLIDQGIDTIFYPCMTYNLDEHLGDNHYNCPVVAYYPEVISANMPAVRNIRFIHDYVGLDHRHHFPGKLYHILKPYYSDITKGEVKRACDKAYEAYEAWMQDIRTKGAEMVEQARRENRRIICLIGRPYHVDPEINHGIDRLIAGFGAAVITEDSLSAHMKKEPVHVLNQWTYHSRLYATAKYITSQPDINLVQLVSFGCGVDAITTDEVREILEESGKIYTQIKIDEITNLGAVRIRLRSLFAAIDQQEANKRKEDESIGK